MINIFQSREQLREKFGLPQNSEIVKNTEDNFTRYIRTFKVRYYAFFIISVFGISLLGWGIYYWLYSFFGIFVTLLGVIGVLMSSFQFFTMRVNDVDLQARTFWDFNVLRADGYIQSNFWITLGGMMSVASLLLSELL